MSKLDASYNWRGKKIKYSVWSNGELGKAVHFILYLGSLQTGIIPKIVLGQCPPRTIVVQGAPHWRASKSGDDIPEFMRIFSEEAYAFIARRFVLEKPHIIAESQAAPGAVVLGVNKQLDALTLMQPLGLNPQVYSRAYTENTRELNKRIKANLHHQLPALFNDSGQLFNFLQITGRYQWENVRGRAHNQYGSGLGFDVTPSLKRYKGTVTIVVGENDRVFPPHEYVSSIRKLSNIHIVTVPDVPHSSLLSKPGKVLLKTAFDLALA